jgi:hypothetical protein
MRGEELQLPGFLNIIREVTKEPYYSMYNLSRRDSSIDSLKNHSAIKLTQLVSLNDTTGDKTGSSNGAITNGTSEVEENGVLNGEGLHAEGAMLNGHV